MKHLIFYFIEYLLIPALLTLWGFLEKIISKEKNIGKLNLKLYNSNIEYLIVIIGSLVSLSFRSTERSTDVVGRQFYMITLLTIVLVFVLLILSISLKSFYGEKRKGVFLFYSGTIAYFSFTLLFFFIIYFWAIDPNNYKLINQSFSIGNYNVSIIPIISILLCLMSFFVFRFYIYKRLFTDLLEDYLMTEAADLQEHAESSEKLIKNYEKVIRFSFNKHTQLAATEYLSSYCLDINKYQEKGLQKTKEYFNEISENPDNNSSIQDLIKKVKITLNNFPSMKESFIKNIKNENIKTQLGN